MKNIVVGVSGKDTGHAAISWAMEFASPTHTPVEFVHVVDNTWGGASDEYVETALLRAEEKLRDTAAQAQSGHPQVPVSSHVLVGSPNDELVAAASDAELLVIGAHPTEARKGRRPVGIASLATGSVVIVPTGPDQARNGVVVGVDGSAHSAGAIAFAAALADRYGEPLTAIYSWVFPEAWGVAGPPLLPIEPSEDDRLILAESIAGLAEQYPDLEVRSEVVTARPADALYAASVGARMLVVGNRGRRGLTKMLLGSVSEELVGERPCPVAIIRS